MDIATAVARRRATTTIDGDVGIIARIAVLEGTEVQIYDCMRVPGDGISSRVVDVSEHGVTVQLIGGRIVIKRVRPAGEGKMPANEWAAAAGLSAGDVLGS